MAKWLIMTAAVLALGCDAGDRDAARSSPGADPVPAKPVGQSAAESDSAEARAVGARAELVNAQGESVGTATFEPMTPSGVRIHLDLRNLPPGELAIHIHEKAKCDPPAFESAGEHFSPGQREHGLENPKGPHAGDLPNIKVGSDGRVKTTVENPRVTLGEGEASLLAGNGTALVIHAKPDDHKTSPSGGAGERIACGPIRKAEAPKEAK